MYIYIYYIWYMYGYSPIAQVAAVQWPHGMAYGAARACTVGNRLFYVAKNHNRQS